MQERSSEQGRLYRDPVVECDKQFVDRIELRANLKHPANERLEKMKRKMRLISENSKAMQTEARDWVR